MSNNIKIAANAIVKKLPIFESKEEEKLLKIILVQRLRNYALPKG